MLEPLGRQATEPPTTTDGWPGRTEEAAGPAVGPDDLELVRSMALSAAELWHDVLRRLAEVQHSQRQLTASIEALTSTVRHLVVDGHVAEAPADLPAAPPPLPAPGAATPWAAAVWPPAAGSPSAEGREDAAGPPPDPRAADPRVSAADPADTEATASPAGAGDPSAAETAGAGGPAATLPRRRWGRLGQRHRRSRRHSRRSARAATPDSTSMTGADAVVASDAPDNAVRRQALEAVLDQVEQPVRPAPFDPGGGQLDPTDEPAPTALRGAGHPAAPPLIPQFSSLLPPPPPRWTTDGGAEGGGVVDAALDAARRGGALGHEPPPEVPEPVFYVPPLVPEGAGGAPPPEAPSAPGTPLPPPPAPASRPLSLLPPPPGPDTPGSTTPGGRAPGSVAPPGPLAADAEVTEGGPLDLSQPFPVLHVAWAPPEDEPPAWTTEGTSGGAADLPAGGWSQDYSPPSALPPPPDLSTLPPPPAGFTSETIKEILEVEADADQSPVDTAPAIPTPISEDLVVVRRGALRRRVRR